MGVFQLTSYLQNDKTSNVCYEVDIVKLAQEYERKEGRQPVIVVDGAGTLYTFYDCKRNYWLMEGQLSVCIKRLQKFVDAFTAAGIKMVFFFDGSVLKKNDIWMRRQITKIGKQKEIFQRLKNGKFPMIDLLPALLRAYGRFMYQQELDCEVLVSVGERDVEMASFARANKCFAFLAQDTDLLIHKGAQFFLSLKDLNIVTMRTRCYDREALIKSLSLDENHLPLFASLMGNDFVPSQMLTSFHAKLCSGKLHLLTKVEKIADYVKKFSSGDLCRSHLTAIADEVFGDRDMAECLENSINLYSGSATISADKDWDVMSEARNRHKTCQMPPQIYPIMRGQPYELSIGLEDFAGGIEGAAKVYRHMRQRLYGVLLHDDPTHQDTVEEWCVEANTISETTLRVEVHRVPENLHPGLLRLWTEKSNVMDKMKWKIFSWCISPDMDESALHYIHPKYLVPATVLYYIVHQDEQLLFKWEVEAIVSQAVILQTMKFKDLVRLRTPIPETRAVQVASLFGQGITTVLLVMAACGIYFEQMMPWVYYDGKLFLQQYMLAKEGQDIISQSVEVQVKCEFQSVWKFVYGTFF